MAFLKAKFQLRKFRSAAIEAGTLLEDDSRARRTAHLVPPRVDCQHAFPETRKGFLRIAVFFDSLAQHGGTCSIEHIGPALREMGHDVRIYVRHRISQRESNQYVRRLVDNGIQVVSGHGVHNRFSDLVFFLSLVAGRFLWRPHVMIVVRADSASLLNWSRTLRLPALYAEATNPSPVLAGEWWYRDLGKHLSRARLVLAPSSRSKAALIEYHHVSAPVEVVPFAIDRVPRSLESRAKAGPVRVGTTCRLNKNTGLDFLVEAARRLADADIDVAFVLWGSGNHQASLQSQVSRLGLADRFEFAGDFDAERNLREVMDGIDVYVLPSLLEGMPISIIEAMAYGRPVIATDCGGITDLVEHEATGYVVPQRDSRALAEAISRLVESPELRETMGRLGRRKVQTSYTSRKVARLWVEKIRHVLDQQNQTRKAFGVSLRLAEGLGRLFGRLPGYRNPGGVFFFFKWARLGGAEAVHSEITRLVTERSPWVCISEPVAELGDLGGYPNSARLFSNVEPDEGALRNAFLLGVFSAAVNRCVNPLVMGGHSRFFYQLIKRLEPHVTRVDILHGYGADLVDSASSAPDLELRITVCEAVRRHLEAVYLENNIDTTLLARTTVIGAATEIPAFDQVLSKSRPFKVVFVGRGCAEKRVHLAGKISSGLFLEYGIKLTFVGDVEDWVYEEDRPRCRFVGHIEERERLLAALADAHAIVITSSEEGVPLALMEAMARRVVPIVTDAGGLSEQVQDGVNGFLVRAQAEEEIVDAFIGSLKSLVEDPVLAGRMADRAYTWAREHYSRKRFADTYRNLFDAPREFVAESVSGNDPDCLISVVVYSFNNNGLEATLGSVLDQSFENFEIRIIDDCSEDDIGARLVAPLDRQRVRYARQRAHYGFAATMNRLVAWSRGAIVVPLSCGDCLVAGGLQEIWDVHEDNPHAALIQFPVTLTDGAYDTLPEGVRSVIDSASGDSVLDVGPVLQSFKKTMIGPSLPSDGVSEAGYWKDIELRLAEISMVKWHDRALSRHPVKTGSVLDSPEDMLEASIDIAVAYRDAGRRCRDAGSRVWRENTTWRMIVEGLAAQQKLGKYSGSSSLEWSALRIKPFRTLLTAMQGIGLLPVLREFRSWLRRYPGRLQTITAETNYLPRMFTMRDPRIQHNTGEVVEDAICCYRNHHEPGHCVFGPGFRVRENDRLVLTVTLEFENAVDEGPPLVNIDVYDNSSERVLAEKAAAAESSDNGTRQVDVPFDAVRGQRLELRVWWFNSCDLRVPRLYLRSDDVSAAPSN